MPYNHPIPDAPIAPAMLPRVAAADLTSQDVLILTQPRNNPGEKNKGLTAETETLADLKEWLVVALDEAREV